MSADMLPGIIAIIGVLVLVGSGLMKLRLPRTAMLRLALLWVGIIATLWGVVTLALHFR